MKKLISIFLLSLFGMFFSIQVSADRLKDLVSFAGIRSNQLMGYGIVVGLDGTGDSSLALTLQSMQSTISQFGMNVDSGSLSGKNSAAVMITADLDPFTKIGQKITVTVSSMGKAKSLRGGTLLMTPLKGADGQTYAIAQGNLAVGGFGVEGADGSSMSVNIPTVAGVSSRLARYAISLVYPRNVIVTVDPSLTKLSTTALTTVLSSARANSIDSPEL